MALEHSLHQDKLKEPYVGPRPFEEDDEAIFFGRDQEVSELAALVTAHQLVLFYAQSGAGKTSLLKARLIPLLKKRKYEVLPPARVRGQDSGPVEVSRETNIYIYNALEYLSRSSLDPARRAALTLADFLPTRQQSGKRDVPPLRVIVFDQFEELFTLYPERYEDRQRFFEQVRDAVRADPLLRVIFAMREDYIAELDPYTPILPDNLQTRYRLTHLGKESARVAIEKPLEKADTASSVKRRFTPAAAEKLVNNLRTIHIKTSQGEKEALGPFVEPVQLQVVCQTLWRKLAPSVEVITEADVEEFGNVEKALLEFYEEGLRKALGASADKNLTEVGLRTWFGRTLITPEGVRGTVFSGRQSEKVGDIPRAAITELENQRLIRAELRGTETWYELSHDRFIQPIREANERWLKRQPLAQKKGEELEQRAAQWAHSGKPRELLLDQAEWRDARRWMESPEGAGVGYSDTLLAYIQASEAAQQKKRVRVMVAGSALLIVLLLLMGGITFYAFQQRNAARKAQAEADALRREADKRRQEAETSRDEARQSQTKAQESEKEALKQAGLAGKAATEAEAQKRLADAARVDAERQRGLAVTAANQAIAEKSRADELKTLAEGSKLAATSELQREQQPGLLNHSVLMALESLAMSGSNPSIEGEQALRHSLAILPRQVRRTDIRADALAFNSGGTLTVLDGGKVERFDQAGQPLPGLPLWSSKDSITSHLISRNGEYAASVGNSEAVIANLLNPGQSVRIRFGTEPGTQGGLERYELSPDGSYFAGMDEKTLRIWKTSKAGEPVLTIDRIEKDDKGDVISQDGILSFAFNSNGDYLALRRTTDVVIYGLEEKRVVSKSPVRKPVDDETHIDASLLSDAYIVMGSNQLEYATSTYNEVLVSAITFDLKEHQWRVILQDKVDQLVLSQESKYLAAVTGNTATVWDFWSGREVMRVSHAVPIVKLVFSPDSRFFATSSEDRTVRIWDLGSKKEVLRIGTESVVSSFDFSHDGKFLATSGEDGLRLWDATSNGESHIVTSEKSNQRVEAVPQNIFYSPNGKYFATISRVNFHLPRNSGRPQPAENLSSIVRIWDAINNREFSVASPDGDERNISKVVFSLDGNRFVTQNYKSATVWEVAKGQSKRLRKLEHNGSPLFIEEDFRDISALIEKLRDGQNPLAAYLRTQLTPATQELLKNYDKSETQQEQLRSALKDEFNNLITGPSLYDKQRFAEVGLTKETRELIAQNPKDEKLVELNSRLLEDVYHFEIFKGRGIEDVAYSPDGKYIATAGRDATVIIWDAISGNQVSALADQGRVAKVVFSPDSKTLATLEAHPDSHNTTSYISSIWKLTGGEKPSTKLLARDEENRLPNDVLKFSRSGKYLATSQRIYNVANIDEPIPISLDAEEIYDIAFSPDEQTIAVLFAEGDSGSGVSFWTKAGPAANVIRTQGRATKLVYSPDGQLIATGGGGLLAQVWEVKSGQEVTRVTHSGTINTLYFSPEGKYLVTAGIEPTVRLTLMNKDDLIREACSRLGSNLTPEESRQYLMDKNNVHICKP